MKKLIALLTVFLVGCVSYLPEDLNLSMVQLQKFNRAFCSGVIIAKNRVLTNAHCVEYDPEGSVVFRDRTTKPYKVIKIGNAEQSPDLALLEVKTHLPPVIRGKMPKIGTEVVTVSSPFGLGWLFSTGVVSNPEVRLIDPYWGHDFGIFIAHTVAIAPGSSGSGLFTLGKELIGLNARGGGGFGFAVPIDQIEAFLAGT